MSRSSSKGSLSSDDEYYGDNGEQFRGEIIHNKYALIEKVGYGSYSSVWLVYNIQNMKYYAMKIQNSEDYDEGVEEMRILNKLKNFNSKSIINLEESFEYIQKNVTKEKIKKGKKFYMKKNIVLNKFVCMVMPLMAGSIYSVIREGKYKKGLPLPVIKKCIKSLLDAMLIVHEKIKFCHTDLKPENILISGISIKVQEIIDEYNSFNLNEITQKEISEKIDSKNWDLSNPKNKKRYKRCKSIIFKKNHKDILSKMVCLDSINSDTDSDKSTESEKCYNTDDEIDERIVQKLQENFKLEDNNSLSGDNSSSDENSSSGDNSLSDTDSTDSNSSSTFNEYEVIDDKIIQSGNIVLTDLEVQKKLLIWMVKYKLDIIELQR